MSRLDEFFCLLVGSDAACRFESASDCSKVQGGTHVDMMLDLHVGCSGNEDRSGLPPARAARSRFGVQR
jgi:hypothetical protein